MTFIKHAFSPLEQMLAATAIFALVLSAVFQAPLAFATQEQSGGPRDEEKVRICHANANGYDHGKKEVDEDSIDNESGHDSHDTGGPDGLGDIIPPFGDYPGKNWDSEHEAIWNNDCVDPEEEIDQCPNIDDLQKKVPEGLEKDEQGNCIPSPEEVVTVVAHKIVCTDEADLPNWGAAGGPNISSTTASNWVQTHDSCSLVSGWDFEWVLNSEKTDPGDAFVGVAGGNWTTFGSTDANGMTSVTLTQEDLNGESMVWVREVLKNGYIPFSNESAPTNSNDVSAEFYCHTDVINYDNLDWIAGIELNSTYHCVAWNVAKPEICEDDSALNYGKEGKCEYPNEEENSCLIPSTEGDNAEFVIGTSPEKSVQTIFDENGFIGVDVEEDQMNYQVWDFESTSTNEITFNVTILGGVTGNIETFGYYKAGDTTSFTPLFVIPPTTIGTVVPVTIPATFANSIGFAIQTAGTQPNTWYTEKGLNTDGKDNVIAYNPEENVYLLAFEDLKAYDNDYNDLVVKITGIECVTDEETPLCQTNLNLLKNGGFETPVVTHSSKWDIFSSGIDWAVSWIDNTITVPAVLELHRGVNGWLPFVGNQYAELDSDQGGPSSSQTGESASVRIEQTVATEPGATYELSYRFSPRPDSVSASENVLKSYIDTDVVTVTGDGSAMTNTEWEYHTKTFVADSASTVIAFEDGGTSNSVGTFLDDACLLKVKDAPVCINEPEGGWADTVEDADQALRKDGSAITDPARTDPTEALGEADWISGGNTGFFSLGFGGSMIVGFDTYVPDVAGADISIHEATNGTYPVESASIEVSQNGTTWFAIGTANNTALDRVTYLDFSGTGLTWVKYVRITDTTNPLLHSNDADGFDVDAVDATQTVCDKPEDPDPHYCTVTLVSDTNTTVVEKGGAAAKLLTFIHEAWDATISGASWIWGDDPVAAPVNGVAQTFERKFGWSGPVVSATLTIASDNTYTATLNGSAAGTDLGEFNYASADTHDVTSLIQSGNNELSVEVTNLPSSADPAQNPAGLMYKLEIVGTDENCDIPYEEEEPKQCLIEGYKYDEEGNPLSGWIIGLAESYVVEWDGEMEYSYPWLVGVDTTDSNGYYCIKKDIHDYDKGSCDLGDLDTDGEVAFKTQGINNIIPYAFDTTHFVFEVLDNKGGWDPVKVEVDGVETPFNSEDPMDVFVEIDLEETDQVDFYNTNEDAPTYLIDGVKWNDEDDDGVRDEGEDGIQGWVIRVTDGEDTRATTTDANGHYWFEVPAGDWVVSEVQQSGWEQTAPTTNEGTCPVTLPQPVLFSSVLADDTADDTTSGTVVDAECNFGNHQTSEEPELSCSLSASENPVSANTNFDLIWTTAGADYVELEGNGVLLDGSQTTSIDDNKTFTLVAYETDSVESPSVQCQVTVNIRTSDGGGGGGGGSRSPRCDAFELDDDVLSWETRNGYDLSITQNGDEIFSTEDNDDTDEGTFELKDLADAGDEFVLTVNRGNKDDTCTIEIPDDSDGSGGPEGEVLGESTSIMPLGAANTGRGGTAQNTTFGTIIALLGMFMSLVTIRRTQNG